MHVPETPSPRLFLGLWPTATVRERVAAHADDWQWPADARRTPPERLHLTLHFLGNVPAAMLPVLAQGLVVDWPGCELLLDRAEVWPGGIAVLEAGEVPPDLARLHAVLRDRLLALELPVETRRYRPHVTLARKGAGARPAALDEPLRWQAPPGYALVQSVGGGRGYRTLQCFG